MYQSLPFCCGNDIAEIERKKNCGNDIAEIEGKKNCWNWFAENCQNCCNLFWIFILKSIHILILQLFFFLPDLCVCHGLSFRIIKVPYETNNDRFKYIEYIDSSSKKKYIDSYSDSCPCMKESYGRKEWLMCTL